MCQNLVLFTYIEISETKKNREIDLFLLYFTKTFVKYRNKINSKKKICSPQIMAHVPPFVNVKW